VKLLLLDDPIGSLSPIEDQLQEAGFEVVRTWDANDATQRCSSEKFDGIIASAMGIMGEAVTFSLAEKMKRPDNLRLIILTPYAIPDEDRSYLKSLGVDNVVGPGANGILGTIKEWGTKNNGSGPAPQLPDRLRTMRIARLSYEAALKDFSSRAKKLDEILENSSDVIYELDPYGKITLISKAIERLTGYPRDQLIGMSALDVTSADSLEVVASHISMLLSGEADPPPVEVGVQAKNGHVIPAEMIVRPIRHENQVVGILGIGRNVEEKKRLEENLRRIINEKDFYLDLMSHDLQNFNQAILGYLEMILATEELDPKLERYAKGALRQVMQTATLIAHLKRVAQVRMQGTQNTSVRDLKEIVQRSVTKIQSTLNNSDIIIAFECKEDKCPVVATDDVNDLISLLVSATTRYALSGFLHLRIDLSSELREGQRFWTIEITGNNLKLAQPVIQCIMSQDYSGCLTIERPDLQLLVVRAIVETQGGTIEARTHENGRGDRFVIRFPQA
jgi:PAS domain S-box-containing protein